MRVVKALILLIVLAAIAFGANELYNSKLKKETANQAPEKNMIELAESSRSEVKEPKIVEPVIDIEAEQDASRQDGNVLNLSGRGLTNVPNEVFLMKDLVELNLSDNRLTGALPSEIKELENLRILKVSSNQMTGLPAEIGQLNNLEILDVSNNQIIGLPYELGNLKNLKTFNLSGNNYSSLDFDIISKEMPEVNFILQ
jgi:Leucine-rich repeat (LRR) protein